jgi:Arc/MetJ-type ribon-helix-helix transcriptional regulator
MKRTTISLPDDLAGVVEHEARQRRTSVSDIVRAALMAHFRLDEPRRLPFESLGASGYSHTARDMEDILAREWGDAIDRDR